MPDFFAMNLVEDNYGLTPFYYDFEFYYGNDNDSMLGISAPTDMFIAKTIGQESLVFDYVSPFS